MSNWIKSNGRKEGDEVIALLAPGIKEAHPNRSRAAARNCGRQRGGVRREVIAPRPTQKRPLPEGRR
jgi:hypothetical protein